jgi:hypothetical protein
MSRWQLKLFGAWLALSALASCTAVAQAAGISLNFGADINAATAVGGSSAGVAFLGNWNDVPLAQQTNLGLKNDSGAIVPGLTLSTAEAFTYPASAFDAAGSSFAQPGDTALMRGHIYHGGGTAVDLTFTGTIPFSTYDVYVYYNSGGIANAQTFSILDSSGGSLGLSQTGAEVPGGYTAFILSDGAGNNANYVCRRISSSALKAIPADTVTSTDCSSLRRADRRLRHHRQWMRFPRSVLTSPPTSNPAPTLPQTLRVWFVPAIGTTFPLPNKRMFR